MLFQVTDLKTKQTFNLETWRRGSRILHASVMPAVGPIPDRRVELRAVPLYIRKAARFALTEHFYRCQGCSWEWSELGVWLSGCPYCFSLNTIGVI